MISVLTALVYFGTVAIMVLALSVSPVLASVAGQLLGIGVAYYGHALFSFQVKPGRRYFSKFACISLATIVVNIAIVGLLTNVLLLGAPVAIAAVAIIVPLATFMLNRFWVFLPGVGFGASAPRRSERVG